MPDVERFATLKREPGRVRGNREGERIRPQIVAPLQHGGRKDQEFVGHRHGGQHARATNDDALIALANKTEGDERIAVLGVSFRAIDLRIGERVRQR